MKIRLDISFVALGAFVSMLAVARPAAGQDGTPGNALNPRTTSSVVPKDPEGIGIVEASRTPTGYLTPSPSLVTEARTTSGGLRYRASVEFGALGLDGDRQAAKFREYKDLARGAYVNSFTLMVEESKRAFHLDAVGGGVGRSDQFYGVDLGRYNAWRVRGSFSETPHVFTATYRSLWNGVGTNSLSLTSLRPGGTTNANTTQTSMLQAIAATPGSDLDLVRQKSRARLDLTLPAGWNAFASYTEEHREGSRPFGAVFGGGGGGGNLEVPESIDYDTRDLVAGLQFAGPKTSASVRVAASFFENNIDTMTFENPLFINTNTIAGVASTVFTRGQFDLYPSNQSYNVRAEVARKLPRLWRGRATGLVSIGRSRQNDSLVPWSLESLAGGTINGVSTASVWDSTGALTRTTANARIDTRLADGSLLLNPTGSLAIRGKVRYYETDNGTDFLACNPLTGQWGRLLNNGSGGSFVTPNLTAGNNPAGTVATGYNGSRCDLAATRALALAPSAGDVPLRTAPYEYRQVNAVASADYRLSRAHTLEAGYERENFRRVYRERLTTSEDKLRFAYVNRGFEAGTLRVSYELGRRRGGDFVAAPLDQFYSSSLGPVPTATGTNMATWFRNVDQFRRFDVADRDQHVFNARFNHGIGAAVDVSVGLQLRDVEFPSSAYGRNERQKLTSPSVEINWQVSPSANAYGFYSYQEGRQHQAGLQQNGCTMGNYYFFFSDGSTQTNATGVAPAAPAGTSLLATERVLASNWQTLCGAASASSPLFPTSRAWDVSQKDRNTVGGVGFHHELGRVMSELVYTYSKGRTGITYGYNAAALGLNAVQVALAGNGFADLGFVQNQVEANAVVPLVKRLSLRLIYRYEKAEIRDWHYDGISDNPMPANNAAYLDFGPRDYKVHVFGALFRYEL